MTKAIAAQELANPADAVASLPFLTGRHKLTVALARWVATHPAMMYGTRPPMRKLPPGDNNFLNGGKGGPIIIGKAPDRGYISNIVRTKPLQEVPK